MKLIAGAILFLAASVYACAGTIASTTNYVASIMHTAMTIPLLAMGTSLFIGAWQDKRNKKRSSDKSEQQD